MKQCVKCKEVKPLDDFHSQGGGTKRGNVEFVIILTGSIV